MKKFIPLTSFLFFTYLFVFNSKIQAQTHKYDWSKYTKKRFKEDTIATFDTRLVKEAVIENIKKSTADVEIRFSNPYFVNRAISGIKLMGFAFYKDSIIIYTIQNEYSIKKDGSNTVTTKKRSIQIDFHTADSLIKTLQKKRLFTIKDQTNWLESFEKQSPELYEQMAVIGHGGISRTYTTFFEIKSGIKFRNYNLQFSRNDNSQYSEMRDLKLSFMIKKYFYIFDRLLQSQTNQ